MLFEPLFAIVLFVAVRSEKPAKDRKPYVVFPVPLDLPNRNDRSEQCWLRIEDVELTETITVYCYLAQEFLDIFIRDYNSRKMMEDDVDVSLWREKPRPLEKLPTPKDRGKSLDSIVDWRVTTLMDPTTHHRIYVSKSADCKIIMYSREGMTSYQVDCDKILYFINIRMNSCSVCKVNVIVFLLTLFVLL